MSSADKFEPLHFRPRVFAAASQCRYRVYRDVREFVVVEAASAADAFRLSGIETPQRIVRESVLLGQNVITRDLLVTPEARASAQAHLREQEAAMAVAQARRQAMTGEQGTDARAHSLPAADRMENPNFMPDASGALPPIESEPPSSVEEAELAPEEVQRLLGEST